jgi:rRNA maturation protein Nop10
MDELFAVNKARMMEFLTTLLEARKTYGWDFNWSFSTHASAALDKDTLEMAKKAGCFYFSYGVESASPRVLESMNKKTKPSQIAEAIRLSKELKLCFGGNFIFGDPAETEDTILETVDFMVHHCLDSNFVYNAIRPYPGSKIFETCMTKGIIKDKRDFYEHVDEQPWDFPYNMTSMPDKVWFPLLDSVVAFGQLFPWTKSVSPYRYEIDTESANSPIVLHTGKQIYKIWAKCPHCGEDICCRELLRLEKELKPKIEATKEHTSFINDIKLVRDAVIKAIRLISFYYFSFRHPVYKLLRSAVRNRGNLLWQSFFSTVFFNTGCPHCNNSVKITIPVPFTIRTFSLAEIKRRLNLSDQ